MTLNDILTKNRLVLSSSFLNEVEQILIKNTINGESNVVNQVANWLTNLIRFLQAIGNLSDEDNFTKKGTNTIYDTTIYDNGVGVFSFKVYYDTEIDEKVVFVDNISWKFSEKYIYNLMMESKSNVILTEKRLLKIIKKVINKLTVQ